MSQNEFMDLLLKVIVGGALLLLLRLVLLWYWKVYDLLKVLGEIQETLKRIEKKPS